MSRSPLSQGKEVTSQRRRRAAIWRTVAIILVTAGIGIIYPWRSVENTEEIEDAQALVDAMSVAHHSIAVTEQADLDEFTSDQDGFSGMETQTPGGVPAAALIGPSGENCLIMHWTAPGEAQVGRLPPEWPCTPDSIAVVPLAAHDGYVPGTGPPFDVTPLIREARTPAWFIVALVALAGLGLRAGVDLFLILIRPDQFFSDSD